MKENRDRGRAAFLSGGPFYVPVLVLGLVITVLLTIAYSHRTEHLLKKNALYLAGMYSERLETVLRDVRDRTAAVRTAVVSLDGEVSEEKFEELASTLNMGGEIMALALRKQDGAVYRYPGNQMIEEEEWEREGLENLGTALAEKMEKTGSRRSVLTAPLKMKDGRTVLAIATPVVLEDGGENVFWGLCCALVDVETVLSEAGWYELAERGYDYELWPEQVEAGPLAYRGQVQGREPSYVDFSVMGAKWRLFIMPEKGWINWAECVSILLTGVCVFLAVSYICYSSRERKNLLEAIELDHEILRISTEESGLTVFLYNWETKKLVFQNRGKTGKLCGEILENIPDSMAEGMEDPEMKRNYLHMFQAVSSGERSASCIMRKQAENGVVWERVTLVNPFPEKYKTTKIIGIIQDITAEKEIELEDEILRLSADYSGLTVFLYNKGTKELTFKNKGGWNLGITAGARLNLKDMEERFVRPESREELRRTFEETAETGRESSCTIAVIGFQEERWKKITLLAPVSRQSGSRQIIGIAEDVTKERRREQQLIKEKAYMEAMIGQSVFHLETNITRNRLLSYNRIPVPEGENIRYEDFILEHVAQIVYPEDAPRVSEALKCGSLKRVFYTEHENHFSMEYRRSRGDGYSWCMANVYLTEIPETSELNAVIVSHNNEEKKKKELELLYKAERDALTGLYNRAACERNVNASLAIGPKSMRSAFLLVDLDNFKEINDTMGHIQGDLVLKEIAVILKNSFRKTDIVGRLGGDEFIVFMRDVKSEDNVRVSAEKLTQLLVRTYRRGSAQVRLSGSIGIAMVPDCGKNFKELYTCADRALYRVKYAEKGGYSFAREDGSRHACGSEENGGHAGKRQAETECPDENEGKADKDGGGRTDREGNS